MEKDRKRSILLVTLILLILLKGWVGGASNTASVANNLRDNNGRDMDAYNGDDEEAKVEKPVPKKKKTSEVGPTAAQFEEDLRKVSGKILEVEKPALAYDYNVMLRPLVQRSSDKSVVCPDKGGGKYNKVCSKAYAEYHFNIPSPGTYYVYVETVAPNINDNSLWVGSPDVDQSTFGECPGTKAGPLVPSKHVKSKKWLCCPKYLESNRKKGQGLFYCECCTTTIGPKGNDMGCILDLEVDSKPHWNMAPREFVVKETTSPLRIRLYAREDGTAFTRVLVSSNPALKTIS